jgi:putative endonuclease
VKIFYLYILHSCKDGTYYIGHTGDLKKRIHWHNAGYSLSTKAKRPWKLVYQEIYQTKSDAQKREYELKRKKSRKYIEFIIQGIAQPG